MWSEHLKTQQKREEERWKSMKIPTLLFYQVRTMDPEINDVKYLIRYFCVWMWAFGVFFIAILKANKTLNYLFWGIPTDGKPRSISVNWDENISLSWTLLNQWRFNRSSSGWLNIFSSFVLYLSWVAVSVMAVDYNQSLYQMYMSRMQYWTDVLLNRL